MIPGLPEAQNVLLVGPVASGKSYILNKWCAPLQRLLVYDTTCEFDTDQTLEQIWGNPNRLADRLREDQTKFRIAYHPKNIEGGFDWTMRLIWHLDLSRHVVIDEVQEVSHLEIMDQVLRYARKRLLGVVGATQRLADVSKTLTANSRLVILFYTQEARDLDTIRDCWGKDAQKLVEGLRPLIYDDAARVVRQTPQALIIYRGSRMEVQDIGDNVIMGRGGLPLDPREEEDGIEVSPDGEV